MVCVAAVLLLALWPSRCMGKFSGDRAPGLGPLLGPYNLSKVCETPLDTQVSWTYNPETFVDPQGREGLSYSTGPVPPNWGQFALVVGGGAGATLIVLTLGLLSGSPRRARLTFPPPSHSRSATSL